MGRLGEVDWRGLDRRRGMERKTVRLTPEFRERVQAWADEQGVGFSSALETLALLGIGDAPRLAVMPAVISASSTVRRSRCRCSTGRSGRRSGCGYRTPSKFSSTSARRE